VYNICPVRPIAFIVGMESNPLGGVVRTIRRVVHKGNFGMALQQGPINR